MRRVGELSRSTSLPVSWPLPKGDAALRIALGWRELFRVDAVDEGLHYRQPLAR